MARLPVPPPRATPWTMAATSRGSAVGGDENADVIGAAAAAGRLAAVVAPSVKGALTVGDALPAGLLSTVGAAALLNDERGAVRIRRSWGVA